MLGGFDDFAGRRQATGRLVLNTFKNCRGSLLLPFEGNHRGAEDLCLILKLARCYEGSNRWLNVDWN
jgi:hypothetical protein